MSLDWLKLKQNLVIPSIQQHRVLFVGCFAEYTRVPSLQPFLVFFCELSNISFSKIVVRLEDG